MEFIKEHWKYLLGMTLVIVALYIGYSEYKESKTAPLPRAVTKANIGLKETTAVSYAPKATPRDSDVEITKAQPKVTASFNGQQHSFDAVQGETQKFDKGKLVVDQSSTLTVDVSAEVEKQVEQGIAKAFKEQAKKVKIRVGLEGTVSSDIATIKSIEADANLRVSRQSESFDVDVRVNQRKQSISGTWWFK